MITCTPFIGIADVGSCEATLTVGDLQTGDAVAWLNLPIAHNEWLDKLQDGVERGVIGSTGAMRVDIEAHPGDRLTGSRSTRRVLPAPGLHVQNDWQPVGIRMRWSAGG